jgi:hypothetical protein
MFFNHNTLSSSLNSNAALSVKDITIAEIANRDCRIGVVKKKSRLSSVEDLLGDVAIHGLSEYAVALEVAFARMRLNPRNVARPLTC